MSFGTEQTGDLQEDVMGGPHKNLDQEKDRAHLSSYC